MKFGTLTAILTFCAGATFTLVDIGTDVALAYEYWNGSYFVRPYLLCNETSNGLCPVQNSPYAILTTVWIGLGGSIQFLLVAYFLQRGDNCLDWLPEVAFLVTDNRVFNGPLGRSLHSFALTAHSAYLLHSPARKLTLLNPGQLKLLNMCSRCEHISRKETRSWQSLEARPYSRL